MNDSKTRNGNIELLRCVLMFLIVLWHCSMCCERVDARVAKLIACLPIFAVDAFIFISGWYGMSFSVKKVIRLLGLGLFSACVIAVSSCVLSPQSSFLYSLGWFGGAYLGLMVLSPLINEGLDKLMKTEGAVVFWLAYLIVVLVSWLPLDALGFSLSVPGFGGMTLNTMMFVYITGRLMRKKHWFSGWGWSTWLVVFAVLECVNVAFGILSGLTRDSYGLNLLFAKWRVNDSPLAIAMAVAFFMMFMKAKDCGALGRVASYLAPSMFSIYLLHCGTNFDLTRVWIGSHLFPDKVDGLIMGICTIVQAAVATFSICLVVDLLRRSLLHLISHVKSGKE